MATMDARQKVIGLVEKLRELDEAHAEKRDAIMLELATVLGGGEGIGKKLERLKRTYSELWGAAYRSGPYEFDHKIDTGHLKRFLKTHSEEEIGARMVSYMRNADPFYVKARHPFLIFVKGFNSLVGVPTSAPIADSTAGDTARKLAGLRGE